MLAKVFKSGNSMALRIPKAIDLKDIKEFKVQVMNNHLVFTPVKQENQWQDFFEALENFKEPLSRAKDNLPQVRSYEVFA